MFHQIENPHQLLINSDLIIGMTSMLLLEAAILNCFTLSVLPVEDEKKWLPNTASGYTPVVTDKNSLINYIKSFNDGVLKKNDRDSKLELKNGSENKILDLINDVLKNRFVRE